MTKKESAELKEEIAKLRAKVEALEKEPRKYEFHYHPPLFINPLPLPPPPAPWWVGPYGTSAGSTGINTQPAGLGPTTVMMNRMEASCVN